MEFIKESVFQKGLIKELKKMFPGSIITKMNTEYIQGIPDLLILWGKRWAILECKRSTNSSKRPNQEYYVNMLNNMSFCRFIYPENKTEVLHELEQALKI